MFTDSEFHVPHTFSIFIKKLGTLDNMLNSCSLQNKAALPNGCIYIAFISGNSLLITHKNLR